MEAFSRILLTGGGTAGHVNPALAIGRALGDERTAFLYVGVRGRAEADIVPRDGIPIRFVRASPYPGARPSFAWPGFLFNLAVGTAQALGIIRSFAPDLIVGTGGLRVGPDDVRRRDPAAAAPPVRARVRPRAERGAGPAEPARRPARRPRVRDRSRRRWPRFRRTASWPATRCGGASSRRTARRRAPRSTSDVPPGRQVVFAFGGSQGARTINRAVVDALGSLLPQQDRLFVIHGTGLRRDGGSRDADAETRSRLAQRYSEEERRAIDGFYVARPYFHNIEQVYALADLVVVRGGAGTLNEVAALGLPAIVVPKINLPGEHQVMNARALAAGGGAAVLYEETRNEDGHAVEWLDGQAAGRRRRVAAR